MNYLEKAKENSWIILILALATFLRFYHLGFQSAWLDEVHTLKESDPNMTLSQFNEVIMFREGIPHLYFLIVRFLSDGLGASILVARIPSAIGGILTVWFVYLLGKELYDRRAGLISALLLTLNFFHIEYSQEARSYALLAFFTTASFYFLVRFVRVMNLKYAILLGLFAGLIPHMHPIGLVNVAAIYLIVLLSLVLGDAKDTKKLMLFSFLSGFVMLAVCSPVYPIVQKVSVINNPWIPALSYDSMYQVLVLLSGNSKIVLMAVILSIACFFAAVAVTLSKKDNRDLYKNKLLFGFLILFIWVFSEIGGIVLKSYIGDSIILHRYFIAILPAMMLFLGICITLIKNNLAKTAIVFAVSACLVFAWFSPINYYSTLTKSQYDKVSEKVKQENTAKDKVVSNWGWLMSYYFNRDNKNKPVVESPLERYLEDLKNGAVNMASFWYLDGNSRPYALGAEQEQYVKDNFIIDKKIEMVDAWAYHFKATKIDQSNLILDLTNFENAMFDGSGAMIFVENKTSKYPPLYLEKGKYKLIVKGVSLPEKPINNENAHFNLFIDGVKAGSFSLTEDKNGAPIEIRFEIPSSKEVALDFNYDNDIVVGADDRNAVVQMIKIVKE